MDIFRFDVNLADKVLIEPSVAAVAVGRCRIILVDAVDFYTFERNFSFLVPFDKLLVESHRRGTRSESETENPVTSIDG